MYYININRPTVGLDRNKKGGYLVRIVKEHDERKNEIIDTAETFFITKGYDKTTINDILKKIGIAKGTFYHYFKSKEEVMDAVIMRVVEKDAAIAKDIAKQNDVSALDKILQFLITQASSEDEQKSDILEQFPKVENALMKQRALEATIEHICPILAEIIEAGVKDKEFTTPYPLEAIQFLIAGIQSLVDEGTANQTQEVMKQRVHAFIDIIFRVLGIHETKDNKEDVTKKFALIFGE
jgi:AcrR family transcriptional regulator